MITDSSYSAYIRRLRAATLASHYNKNINSVSRLPVDESTYLVQKTGCCSPLSSTDPVFVPPVFSISCSDINGTQVLPSLPTTAFTLSPASAGAGAALVQYVDASSEVIGSTVISTTSGSVTLTAPPAGTASVQYTFPCTPTSIDISCGSSAATNAWQPYQFHNTELVSVYISFTPGSVAGQWIDPNGLSTTVAGITSYSVDCTQTKYRLDISSNQTVVAGTTISIYNAYDKAAAIQFYNASDVLVIADQYNNTVVPIETAGSTGYIVVPAGAVRFTATAALATHISSCSQYNDAVNNYLTINPSFPILLFGDVGLVDTFINVYNSFPTFIDNLPSLLSQSIVLSTLPPSAVRLTTGCI